MKDFASSVESFKADNQKLQVTYLPPLSMTVFGLGHRKKERSPALAADRDAFFYLLIPVFCADLSHNIATFKRAPNSPSNIHISHPTREKHNASLTRVSFRIQYFGEFVTPAAHSCMHA